jgi:2-(1,2-epoxy-1,2-dihydrophenyl)acetyl-CoA isomerase
MPTVLVEHRDALATVTLNRPERRNGLTLDMCRELHDALTGLAASEARVVILRGAGTDFCVGADIGAAAPGEPAAERPASFEEQASIYDASLLLHTMPQVTIAAIDGGCAGAGMGWAAACDLRFAAEEARLSTAFLVVGASGDMGLAWSLTRILGAARARDLMFLPEKLTGADALALGFVTRLFPRAALHSETERLALQLCERDPLALRLMKANALSAGELGFADYLAIETARHLRCANRPEFAARMADRFAQSRRSAPG